MSAGGIILVALAIAVGLAGIVVPVLPGGLLVIAASRKAKGQAAFPELRALWGGGLPSTPPEVVVDYYGGRSVSEVLANPGPLFQREVLDYRAGHPSQLYR